MCLIVTIVMLFLSIQNLMQDHWFIGIIQLLIAIGFILLLLRHIRQVQCDRTAHCNSCVLSDFITTLFKKKDN